MADNTERNAVVLELIFNDDRLQTQLNAALRSTEQKAVKSAEFVNKKATSSLNSLSKSATNVFGGIAKMAIAAFSVKKIAGFTKSCLELGSNLTEVQNVVDTAFKTMSSEADSFAKSAMTNFGMSELSAKKYLGVFGQMSSAMGMSERASLDMAKSVTALTGDVASFYNLNLDEAYTKLKSIWTGETESLKDLGVIMTQTNLDQYALNNGFGKTTVKMTEQEKLMLKFQYVTSSLSNASGDFIKTQNSWANQTRMLSLRFEQLKSTLGQSFIALFTPIIQGLNSCVVGLQKLADLFKDFTTSIMGSSESTCALNEGMSQIGDDALAAASNITAMGDATAAAANLAERSLAGFDKITKLGSSTATSGTSSGNMTSDGDSDSKKEEENVGGIKSLLDNFNTWVKQNFSDVFSYIGDSFSRNTDKLKKNINEFTTDIKKLFKPLEKYFKNDFTKMLQKSFTAAGVIFDRTYATFNKVSGDIWNEAVYPLLTEMVDEGLPMFADFTGRMATLSSNLYTEFDKNFNRIWDDAVSPVLGNIAYYCRDCISTISNAWNEWGEPTFDALNEAVRVTGDTFEKIWNNTLKPIIDNATEKIDEIWIEYLSPLMENLTDFAGEWVNCALTIYNGFIAPLIEMLDKYLGPGIRLHFNNIVNIVTWAISLISNTINSLITTLKGCAQFVSGVFTGDWEKAWTGIKNIFEGIFSKSLVSIVRTAMNLIVGMFNGMLSGFTKGVNAMVGAVNKISFKVPDWVPGIGGNSVGFNIATVSAPKIPMLAQGAYVEANTPQLAMIGDNRHQGEFVAPEDKLAQMAVDAAKMSGNSSAALLAEAVRILKEILKILKELDLDVQIDGESVKKKIVDLINENTRATGKCEIVT